jgi:hypothetical protein
VLETPSGVFFFIYFSLSVQQTRFFSRHSPGGENKIFAPVFREKKKICVLGFLWEDEVIGREKN